MNFFNIYRFTALATAKALQRPAPIIKANENVLFVYGMIDAYFGVSAIDILQELAQMVGDVTVRINSPGGDVYEAQAIAAALERHSVSGKITTVVDSMAASCASMLLMLGSERRMHEGALMMIHRPYTFTQGNASELRDMASVLELCENSTMYPYYMRSGQTLAALQSIADATTWYDAEGAKADGFVTKIDKAPVVTKANSQHMVALAQLYPNFPVAALGTGTPKARVRGPLLSLNSPPTTIKV